MGSDYKILDTRTRFHESLNMRIVNEDEQWNWSICRVLTMFRYMVCGRIQVQSGEKSDRTNWKGLILVCLVTRAQRSDARSNLTYVWNRDLRSSRTMIRHTRPCHYYIQENRCLSEEDETYEWGVEASQTIRILP